MQALPHTRTQEEQGSGPDNGSGPIPAGAARAASRSRGGSAVWWGPSGVPGRRPSPRVRHWAGAASLGLLYVPKRAVSGAHSV